MIIQGLVQACSDGAMSIVGILQRLEHEEGARRVGRCSLAPDTSDRSTTGSDLGTHAADWMHVCPPSDGCTMPLGCWVANQAMECTIRVSPCPSPLAAHEYEIAMSNHLEQCLASACLPPLGP